MRLSAGETNVESRPAGRQVEVTFEYVLWQDGAHHTDATERYKWRMLGKAFAPQLTNNS